jgi:hypothetical protein
MQDNSSASQPHRSGSPLYRAGSRLLELTDTRKSITALAIVVGIVGAAIELVLHIILKYAALPPWATVAADSGGLGLILGAIAWFEARALRERRHRVLAEVQKVGDLNHHVRNALTAIQYAAHLPPTSEHVRIINESVSRIDETLKQLFPGVSGMDARASANVLGIDSHIRRSRSMPSK